MLGPPVWIGWYPCMSIILVYNRWILEEPNFTSKLKRQGPEMNSSIMRRSGNYNGERRDHTHDPQA